MCTIVTLEGVEHMIISVSQKLSDLIGANCLISQCASNELPIFDQID